MRTTFLGLILVTVLIGTSLPSALSWELERPSSDIHWIDERIENASTCDFASVGLGVQVWDYREDVGDYNGNGASELHIIATANTRKPINYTTEESWYYWHDDDLRYTLDFRQFLESCGVWICFENEGADPPFKVRFYGGHGSAEYSCLWIGEQGFISFDEGITKYNFTKKQFPDPSFPNSIIAPFWDSELWMDADSAVKWGVVDHGYPAIPCLCISWENFLCSDPPEE